MKQWESRARAEQKYLKRRKTTYEELNSLVSDWFCAARSKDLPVSGRLIQEKELTLSVEMIQAAHTMQSCLQQERMDLMKLTQKNIQGFFPRR